MVVAWWWRQLLSLRLHSAVVRGGATKNATHTNTYVVSVHFVQKRRQSSVIYTNYTNFIENKLLYLSFESLKNYLRELYIC